MAGNDGRSNNWAFLLWQESMPSYSFKFLEALKLPVFVSPLHDQDLWTYEDCIDNFIDTGLALQVGTPKKPHYHVMIQFSSNKTMAYVLRALAPLHVQYVLQLGNCEKSIGKGWRGYARYLCHLDNPEKHPYDPCSVLSFGGHDYFRDAAVSAPAARAWDCAPIFDFIQANGLTSFSMLLDYCRIYHPDWYSIVFVNSTKFQQYLKSADWSLRHDLDPALLLPSPVDTTTHTQGKGIKSFSLFSSGGVLS